MIKAWKDIMELGNGATILVIAYLLTSILTGWICIGYFSYRWWREKEEHEKYVGILEEIKNESERDD